MSTKQYVHKAYLIVILSLLNVSLGYSYAAENPDGNCVLADAFINGGNSCANFTELDDASQNVWCDGSGIRIDSVSTSAAIKYDNALYPRNDSYKYNWSICMWIFNNQTTNFGSDYSLLIGNSTTTNIERYLNTYTTANAKEHLAVPIAVSTVIAFTPITGNHFTQVCHEFYTNNSMRILVNGTQTGHKDDMAAGETDPDRNKNASYLRIGMDPNLNVPIGVGVANMTQYNLSCIVARTDSTLNITQPNVTNPSTVNAGDSLIINFTLKKITSVSIDNSILKNVTIGGLSADIITTQCGGSGSVCADFDQNQEACTNISCTFTAGSGTSPNYNESFNNTGSAPADWATWQATGNGIFNRVNDVTRCINDDGDDCLCVNSTAETFQGHLKKQSDVDLSLCEVGTAYVYISKLFEVGVLEASDCINISFSNNSGASFTNKTRIFCDDNPPSTLNITIINSSYYVSTFRINITAGGFGAEPEVGCIDGLRIDCQPRLPRCTGTQADCYSYTNVSRCQSAGCNPFKQQFGYSNNFWQVNATMPSGLTGLQDLFVNVTYFNVEFNDTELNAVNYGGAADTCTYSGSGDWLIDCADNCIIGNTNVNGNNVQISGTGGNVEINGLIQNYNEKTIHLPCTWTCNGNECWRRG